MSSCVLVNRYVIDHLPVYNLGKGMLFISKSICSPQIKLTDLCKAALSPSEKYLHIYIPV